MKKTGMSLVMLMFLLVSWSKAQENMTAPPLVNASTSTVNSPNKTREIIAKNSRQHHRNGSFKRQKSKIRR